MILTIEITDWFQGIGALVTAGAAIVTIFIVNRYTDITAKLHEATRDQADAAKDQAVQMKLQFDHEKNQRILAKVREVIKARPEFHWVQTNPSKASSPVYSLRNSGGKIVDIKAEGIGQITARISETAVILQDGSANLTISPKGGAKLTYPFFFFIAARTTEKESFIMRFGVNEQGAIPTVDSFDFDPTDSNPGYFVETPSEAE